MDERENTKTFYKILIFLADIVILAPSVVAWVFYTRFDESNSSRYLGILISFILYHGIFRLLFKKTPGGLLIGLSEGSVENQMSFSFSNPSPTRPLLKLNQNGVFTFLLLALLSVAILMEVHATPVQNKNICEETNKSW